MLMLCLDLVRRLVDTLCMNLEVLEDEMLNCPPFQKVDWKERQRSDPILAKFQQCLSSGQKPQFNLLHRDSQTQTLCREFSHLVLRDGVIYRKSQANVQVRYQLVLPSEYWEVALKGLHDDVGHPGKDRTLWLLQERFYWPRMTSHVHQWIESCERCLKRKSPTNLRAPLVNIRTTRPLELVCIDYLTLEESKEEVMILMITNQCS